MGNRCEVGRDRGLFDLVNMEEVGEEFFFGVSSRISVAFCLYCVSWQFLRKIGADSHLVTLDLR